MKAIRFFCGIVFISNFACSPGDKPENLRSQIWQQFLAVEAESPYQELLTPETQDAHGKNMRPLAEKIPPGYPEPWFPMGRLNQGHLDPPLARDILLDDDIIELGRQLFFDERLSHSAIHGFPGGISCASCHQPDLAFADGLVTSKGVDGDSTPRNSPTILNAAYYSTLTWANPVFPILEMQARIPLFGDDPVEMGLRGREQDAIRYILENDAGYRQSFQNVFKVSFPEDFDQGLIDYNHLTAALAAFERSLISFDTKFDRFLLGENELSADEMQGARLFFGLAPLASGETLACSRCHSGFMLSNSYQYVRENRYYNRQSFHNTGVYNLDGKGAYPKRNTGFASSLQLEEQPELMGQFRVPGLRFVGLTSPYGHDGSFPSLESIIQHYSVGGRAALSPMGQNPFIDPLVKPGFTIEEGESAALVSFLKTLQ